MPLLEDPDFKNKYQKCKYRVKSWESKFIDKTGRKPNKTDIKQADIKIRQAYNLYWHLKTQALEDSLTDNFLDSSLQLDNSTLNNSTLNDSTFNKSVNNSTFIETLDESCNDTINDSILNSTTSNDKSNVLNDLIEDCSSKSEVENKPNNSIDELKNIKGVWNKSLNLKKNDESKNKRLLGGKSPSFQLSQKMFQSSNFVKRNPRKSLSSSSKLSKSKSKEKSVEMDTSTDNKNVSVNDANETINEQDISDEFLESIMDTSVKFKTAENKESCQPLFNSIHQIINNKKCSRQLNLGWIERCSKDIQDVKSTVTSENTERISDDEDFVYKSDSDDEHRRKRVRNFRKLLSEGDHQETKRMCLDNIRKCSTEPLRSDNFDRLSPNGLESNAESEALKANKEIVSKVEMPLSEVKKITSEVETPISSNETKVEVSIEKISNDKIISKGNSGRKRTFTKYKDDSESEYNDECNSDSEHSDNFTEASKRKRTIGKKVNNKGKPGRKPRAVTATRKSTRIVKKQNQKSKLDSMEEEVGEEEEKRVGINTVNTFEIDNVNAVARLALMPVATTGSLVEDFARVLKDNKNLDEASTEMKSQYTRTGQSQKKNTNATDSGNYVRLNLKKKIYVRGRKHFNLSTYKKNIWKQRKKDLATSQSNMDALDFLDSKGTSPDYCFKCKETGHFSKYCPNKEVDSLLPEEELLNGEIPSEFPTLEEAEQMAQISKAALFSKTAPRNVVNNKNLEEEWDEWEGQDSQDGQLVKEICKVPLELVEKLLPPEKSAVPPLYSLNSDNSVIDTPEEVYQTLKQFGFDNFRSGQEKAIMRILSGISTLVTLATGTGKSLCYQLPAFMFAKRYNCITIVVSPLVSLMDDQVKGVPPMLKAACLHTNQTEKVRNDVIDSIKRGKIDVLLVSPEAVVAGEKSKNFGAIFRDLPPIAFACIDEAHCISQWSHNFRPSYLMLCRVLKEKLKVKVILGLTATATKTNAKNIVEHLGIPDGLDGVVTDKPLPENLQLTVSRDLNRDYALVELLKSPRLRDCQSILIYCTRREECVRIAAMLRTVFQEIKATGKKRISPVAEAYHAGFSAYQRKIVQKAFMNGDTRIIVATIAFGMGINKPDIRCVIHYNMPSNFENYVQEIGRAGRDGLPAQCHLFLNSNEEQDKMELRRHIYANAVDRSVIRKLLNKLFIPCSCLTSLQKSCGQRCIGHEVALPLNETVKAFDTNEEIISTLLCYLELHPKNYITVLSPAYVMATVSTYGGCKALKLAAQHSPPLAMAIAMNLKNGTYSERDPMIEFNVIEIASNIGWDSGIVKSHLKSLEWITLNGVTKRSQISVKFHTLGLRVRAPGDLSDTELDEVLTNLFERSQFQETSQLAQLHFICNLVREYSHRNIAECLELNNEILEKSESFKTEIRKYFVEDDVALEIPKQEIKLDNESQILQDIRGLVSNYPETNFTGRAIARIFYGIQTPNYPASIWYRCRYWRSHLDVDFNYLCQLATRELFDIR